MARLLITGISGFVGRHIARRAVQDGYDVVGFDVAQSAEVPVVSLDLRSAQAVREAVVRCSPQSVIHLAGILRSPEPQQLYDAHVIGTVNLLEALTSAGLKSRVVIASSSAIYGDPGSDRPIGEEALARPLTHYAASKLAQEVAALRYQHAGLLPIVVARTFNIVGPGQPSTLAASGFAEQIARAERDGGGDVRVGSLTAIRDFVDVRDVARALLSLAVSGRPGACYNVCSGVGVSMQHCLKTLTDLARVPISVQHEEDRRQALDVRAQIGDYGRLHRETNWRPEVSLERSLADLLDHWRTSIKKG